MSDVPVMEMFDGRKFMWDGVEYDTSEQAEQVAAGYKAERFDTRIVAVGAKFAIYSRRQISEVVVS
ncbi:MAG: hypothetical protein FJ109_13050 [Deltaproteobacteria bacterium]|nr:hypothetical protein [Deltaproteobacteria bacterium]